MTTSEPAPRGPRAARRAGGDPHQPATGRLVAMLLALGVGLGVLVGVLWSQVVSPVEARVADGNVVVDEVAASGWFAIDGWFGVLGAAAGVLVAVFSFLRFPGRPVGVITLNVVAGLVGSVVAWRLGILLGPDRPPQLPAEGEPVLLPLELNAYGVLLIWPMAALATILLINAFQNDVAPWRRDRRP